MRLLQWNATLIYKVPSQGEEWDWKLAVILYRASSGEDSLWLLWYRQLLWVPTASSEGVVEVEVSSVGTQPLGNYDASFYEEVVEVVVNWFGGLIPFFFLMWRARIGRFMSWGQFCSCCLVGDGAVPIKKPGWNSLPCGELSQLKTSIATNKHPALNAWERISKNSDWQKQHFYKL